MPVPERITIPNLHPSQRSDTPEHITIPNLHPSQQRLAEINNESDPLLASPSPLRQSVTDRLGSFVGSYSRTSMNFMADNISIPSSSFNETPTMRRRLSNATQGSMYGTLHPDDLETDKRSTYSNRTGGRPGSFSTLHTAEPGDSPTSSQFPLLYPLIPVMSLTTVAEEYQIDPHSIQSSLIKSTFIQSIFNSINILIGIGILALPLGFRCAGWGFGIGVFVFCCGLTNYTAKLLAKCLDAEPGAHTYGDMGAAAFGYRGRVMVSVLFLTELLTSSVALVVLLGDAIASLFPDLSMATIRVLSYCIITPMVFLPVRHLSYTSLLGIISAASLVVVVMVDGWTKAERPGSLRDPMDTEVWPSDWKTVPLSFGLIMAGFAGHAVFPTVYRDMEEPKLYSRMVDYTYGITFVVYLLMAASGYAMFGNTTMQEITQNLVGVPGYNALLNHFAVWLIAVNPIAKYALTLNPINLTWELSLSSWDAFEEWCNSGRGRRTGVKVLGRCLVSALVVGIATVFPGFDRVMSLLGAFFSFLISAIFPLTCHLRLFGDTLSTRQRLLEWFLLIVSCFMALVGTTWSLMPKRIVEN